MKHIKEHIYEKFAETSDPITDLNIGIIAQIKPKTILQCIKPIKIKHYSEITHKTLPMKIKKDWYSVIKKSHILNVKGKPEIHLELSTYIDFPQGLVDLNFAQFQLKSLGNEYLTLTLEKLFEHFKIVSVNEEFSEAGDPIDDMGIGKMYNVKLQDYISDIIDEFNQIKKDAIQSGKILEFKQNENKLKRHYFKRIKEVIEPAIVGKYVKGRKWFVGGRWTKDDHVSKIKEIVSPGNLFAESRNGYHWFQALGENLNKYGIYINLPYDITPNRPSIGESLLEKFTEEGDPIEDMHIGQNFYKEQIMKLLPAAYGAYGINYVSHIRYTLFSDETSVEMSKDKDGNTVYTIKCWATDNDLVFSYLNKLLYQNINRKEPGGVLRVNSIKINKTTLAMTITINDAPKTNEAFTEKSDPIHDMGIGIKKIYNEWLEEFQKTNRGSSWNLKHVNGALMLVADQGKTEFVDYLIHVLNADPNFDNAAALRAALYHKNYDTAIKLIENGANLDYTEKYCKKWNHNSTLDNIKELRNILNKDVNEGFSEKSDPIADLGIGIRGSWNNLKAGDLFLLKEDLPKLGYKKGSIVKVDSVKLRPGEKYDKQAISQVYQNKRGLLNNAGISLPWNWNFSFFKRYMQPIQNIDKLEEKFEEISDPIKDLGVGEAHKFEKALYDFIYKGFEGFWSDLRSVEPHKDTLVIVWSHDFSNDNFAYQISGALQSSNFDKYITSRADIKKYKTSSFGHEVFIKIKPEYVYIIDSIQKVEKKKTFLTGRFFKDKQMHTYEIDVIWKEVNEKFTEKSDPIKDMGIGKIDILKEIKNIIKIYNVPNRDVITKETQRKISQFLEQFLMVQITGVFKKGFFEEKGEYTIIPHKYISYFAGSKIEFIDVKDNKQYEVLTDEKYTVQEV